MKKLLLMLLVIIPLLAAAKVTDTVISINKLTELGYVLDNGWKFHNGDDMAYAQTGFDDRSWSDINPTLPIPQLPAAAQQEIGWLRIKLNISSPLKYGAAIRIRQCPAVEIYLNGNLIGKRGTINNKLKTGTGQLNVGDPVELPLTNAPVQVLAIRYAYQPDFRHINRYILPALASITFINTPQRIKFINRIKYEEFDYLILISILILLAIFDLTLWQYNKTNRAFLFFAANSTLLSLSLITSFILDEQRSLNVHVYAITAINFLGLAGSLFLIKSLCEAFKFRTSFYYFLLIVASASGVFFELFYENFPVSSFDPVGPFLNIVAFAITVKAIIVRRRGALIIATGYLICLIAVYYLIVYGSQLSLIQALTISLIAWLGPTLSITIFLAREFALDARLLAEKLVQVEDLSRVNLAQEQEKQQLLADQNELLERQVANRTAKLNQSLTDLKQAQTQLIQSEKMASLGELTAGIAHEIQNPLNFVNNFSEVSMELVDEMDEELEKGDVKEASAIASNIKQNLEKIRHHGRRADSIVKGMLQHSRNNSGERQLSDVNALVDEYLRLSYHGLRAKDKSFNAVMTTYFQENLPKINIIPQDIGRVLLNLFNNAFYAIQQKQKSAGADYKPEVMVSTSFNSTILEIRVKDNGTGIPEGIREKILQPFFTTKPTGEGTGLGLSLSYDIIVKVYGGSIDVESDYGKGSNFIIQLPLA